MTVLKKKTYWITTLIILLLSLMKPISIEHSNTAYEYKFGALFPFLSLRLNNFSSGYQDIFSISAQAESYELNIISLVGVCLVCFLISYVLLKIAIALFGKRTN